MLMINWSKEVELRKEQIIEQTKEFLRINSVLDESTATETMPFGKGIHKALTFLMKKGEECRFFTKNLDGYAGLIEHGSGEESVGILVHIDVVPAGEGWKTPPFSAEIRNGRIYARGAIDDKGPTMAAFFAMVIVKELNLPLKKRVRLIIGTDEESEWRCVDHYFKHEEMPTIGFAPDADFPIIYAEKGIADVIVHWGELDDADQNDLTLAHFHAGERLNMVPDLAVAKISGNIEQLKKVEEAFKAYLLKNKHNGRASVQDQSLMLTYEGVSAHGSTPEKGVNAGILLSVFLAEFSFQGGANRYLKFVKDYLLEDLNGEALAIDVSDDVSGSLTVNAGLLRFNEKEASIGLNIRYPVTASFDECMTRLQRLCESSQATINMRDHLKPNYVEKTHPLIQTLKKVYERQMGGEAPLLTSGGATYARSLKTGVAFGALFPGSEDVAHQKDEYIDIRDLLKATAIYAEAIYELAK
ncbi:dipeptidase PepV [bacterium LRH843]|nr:dipeptidase PepV [bacterium LRH843]